MTKLKLTNYGDLETCRRGLMDARDIREVEIEALVDTGATMLILPEPVVADLGVAVRGYRNVRYADGRTAKVPWVGGIQLELLGREMTCDALVEPRAIVALLGQIPLEELDLIVDPKTRELRVNPDSPDAPMVDSYVAA